MIQYLKEVPFLLCLILWKTSSQGRFICLIVSSLSSVYNLWQLKVSKFVHQKKKNSVQNEKNYKIWWDWWKNLLEFMTNLMNNYMLDIIFILLLGCLNLLQIQFSYTLVLWLCLAYGFRSWLIIMRRVRKKRKKKKFLLKELVNRH